MPWPFKSVGVTGTRQGATREQKIGIRALLLATGCKELHEGDCVGVDAETVEIAREIQGIRIVSHPPVNPKYRAYAYFDIERPLGEYLIRNENIVNETQALIGVPKGIYEELRSGTWACIRYARKIKRPTYIVQPNGNIVSC